MKTAVIINRFQTLKSARAPWETSWTEILKYCIPRKNDIMVMRTPGQLVGQELFDATAPRAVGKLAGLLHGWLTNPSIQWLEYATGFKDLDYRDEVRFWLQNAADTTNDTLNNSNFQTEIHEFYIDLISIGTGGMSIDEDDETVARFHTRPISEYVIEPNNKNVIDSIYRLFKWNAQQIVDEWPKATMPSSITDALKKGDNKTFEVLHWIFPAKRNPADVPKGKGFAYGSVYILVEAKTKISKGGFRERPYVVSRYTKTSGEAYGRSPSWDTMPDIKMINEIKKTTLAGGQQTVRPAMQGPDDGFMARINLTPGAMNYYRRGTKDRIEPIVTGARPDYGIDLFNLIKEDIEDGYHLKELLLRRGPQMTAEETMTRTEEGARFLSPMMGRQHNEFLRPVADRLFAIQLRRGLIPKPPQVVIDRLKERKKDLGVQYSSLIARAQRTTEVQNIQRAFQVIAPLVGINPESRDVIDTDQGVRFVARSYGLPQELIRTEDKIGKIREARAEAQSQVQESEEASRQADRGSKVAAAASQAKTAGLI